MKNAVSMNRGLLLSGQIKRRNGLSQAEAVKRAELLEQMAAERARPLTDQPLTAAERAEIAAKVQTGRIKQSIWPGAGGRRSVDGR